MAKVTDDGAAALAAAATSNVSIPFTRMLIGDGNGVVPNFTGRESALFNQRDYFEINSVYILADNPNQIRIEAEIPWDRGGWTIREAAAADDAGKIYVIGGYAEIVKPPADSEHARKLTVVLVAQVSPQIINAIATFSRERGDGLQPLVLASGNGFPLGYVRKAPFNGGYFKDGHNHEWLQVGLLHTKGGYSAALAFPGLCSYGNQIVSSSAARSGTATQAAVDGDTSCVVFSHLTIVMLIKSGNNAALLFPAHKLGIIATAVVYFDGVFVVAGNTATGCKLSYSTDGGLNFTLHATTIALAGALAGSVRGAASATKAIFAIAGTNKTLIVTKAVGGGIAVEESLLASAVHSGSPPMIVCAGEHFVVASRTSTSDTCFSYKGGAWGNMWIPSRIKGVMQDLIAFNEKFYWVGKDGSGLYDSPPYVLAVSFDAGDEIGWTGFGAEIPEPHRTHVKRLVDGNIRLHVVKGGALVVFTDFNVGHSACYFTANFSNFKLINFAMSATELGGDGAEYFCFDRYVMGGYNARYPLGGTRTSVLSVDYQVPDHVGIHSDGISPIVDGMTDYVRIR